MTRPSRVLTAGSLGRALGKITLIVVGVLIALAVDGWQQDRENRALEMQALRAIARDLVADSVYLANYQGVIRQALPAFRVLGGLKWVSLPEPDSLTVLIDAVAFYLPPPENTAGYASLEQSGQLRIIESEELVRQLTVYYTGDLVSLRAQLDLDAAASEGWLKELWWKYAALQPSAPVDAIVADPSFSLAPSWSVDRERFRAFIDAEAGLFRLREVSWGVLYRVYAGTEEQRAALSRTLAEYLEGR